VKKTQYVMWLAVLLCASLATTRAAWGQTFQMRGTISADVTKLPTFGDAPATLTLPLQIWLKPRDQAGLNSLLAEQQDPKSSHYHQWLTPQEYTARFGPSQAEFNTLSQWLTNQGFQVTGGSPAAGFIGVRGTVLAIGRAFNTNIQRLSADGAKFGNLSDPQLPAEFGSVVSNITGLNNLHAIKPMIGRVTAPPTVGAPHPQARRSPSGRTVPALATLAHGGPDVILCENGTCYGPLLGPSDFYTFYDETPLNNAGIMGTGCIAIVGVSNVPNGANGPIATFNNSFGLPQSNITTILTDGPDPGPTHDAFESEALLDVEWSHAVAPNAATKLFIGTGANGGYPLTDALQGAVSDGSCAVISISFAECGGASSDYTETIGNLVNQAQSQGQTVFVSSGDYGAAGLAPIDNSCAAGTSRNVNELASHPLITSVGGTAFSTSAFAGPNYTVVAHTRERAWNDSDDPDGAIQGGGATGGGASAYFSKPNFQNAGTPNDGARDQPDVALIASPYYPGTWFFDDDGSGNAAMMDVGGTSLAAPTWAGIVNLLVQKTAERVGSVNPTIYGMAGQSSAGFFDITAGDNNFNGVQGFSAGVGYDQTTGWGTVDIATFVNAYAAASSSTATPTPTPTATPTPTSTPTPSPTPTTTATPTPTTKPTTTPTTTPPTPTPTSKPSPTPTTKPTPTPTATPTPRVPAYVKVSTSSLNFGTVRVGRGKVKEVVLTNTASRKGGATVTFNGGSVLGSGEFSTSTTCNGQVGPKRTCSVIVAFAPSSAGAASATVAIKGDAANSPQLIEVTGTGK
jgi:pseudomonalisin